MRLGRRLWDGWCDAARRHAEARNEALAMAGGSTTVFLGDSITEQWLWRDPDFFRSGRLNMGVGGETTVGMLARFDRDVVAQRPRAVHIMGGTNDMWHGNAGPGASLAFGNIVKMVARARAAGIAVILAAPPPISDEIAHDFRTPELFAPLRAAIADLCMRQGLVHVDYVASLSDASGRPIAENMTDGVHISRMGYRAMRGQAQAALRQALRLEDAR
jgi:lysophospholipase L1-like esterase